MNNVEVIGNIFYNISHGWGLQVYSGSGRSITGLLVTNNIFSGANPNRDGQIVLAGTLWNSTVSGNVFYEPRNYGVVTDASSTVKYGNVVISNNNTYGGSISATSPPGITFVDNASHSGSTGWRARDHER
jgi:hypothetical protein